MNELLALGALALARRIAARDVTPQEVVDAHIARIEAVNPVLNAVVAPRFDEARAEARRATDALAGGARSRGPLHGVPCTIKECFEMPGRPWTGGSLLREGRVGLREATVVRRLREAGAIVLGQTNNPEALMWFETTNRIYGRTSNAHDPRRTSGGSSGGEGAIIGAGGSPFGMGSDVGGSIRFPAAFNGCVGHKPSGGLIPITGHWPDPGGAINRINTVGPLGRRVEDLRALVGILAGPDGEDPGVYLSFRADEPIDAMRVRVRFFESNGVARPSAEVAAAVRRAATALAERGFDARRWRPPHLKRTGEMWLGTLAASGGASVAEVIGDGRAVAVGSEFLRWMLGLSPHTFPALLAALGEGAARTFPGYFEPMRELGLTMYRHLEAELGDHGVLVSPVYPTTAPRHGSTFLKPHTATYCGVWNALEMPSTVVPVGFTPGGLPLAVQVAALRGRDALTLWVAERLEETFGGWRPPL
ncbi:MAG: amidase [Myxococcales bacterium]|nr:amidase [Myxococcales bacterium]